MSQLLKLFNPVAAVMSAQAAGISSPDEITGLSIWFDMSDATTLYTDAGKTTPVSADGQQILCYEDKSGQGNDATGANPAGSIYKVNIQNGLSVARQDGATQGLDIASSPAISSGDFTWVLVIRPDTVSNDERLIDVETGRTILISNSDQAGTGIGKVTLYDGSFRNIGNSSSSVQILTFILDSVTPQVEAFINGISIGTSTYTTRAITGAVGIGKSYTVAPNAASFHGDFCEILLYTQALGATDRGNLESYLANKWGITLS